MLTVVDSKTNIDVHRLNAIKTLAFIKANPEKHNQSFWGNASQDCGTTYCVAGTIAAINGDTSWKKIQHDKNRLCLVLNKDSGFFEGNFRDYGREAFGLSKIDAEMLFYRTNEEEAVQALEYLAKGEPIDWVEMDMLDIYEEELADLER